MMRRRRGLDPFDRWSMGLSALGARINFCAGVAEHSL